MPSWSPQLGSPVAWLSGGIGRRPGRRGGGSSDELSRVVKQTRFLNSRDFTLRWAMIFSSWTTPTRQFGNSFDEARYLKWKRWFAEPVSRSYLS